MRAIGFGNFKEGKSIRQWSLDFLDYIDRFTSYRSRSEIDRIFERHFAEVGHEEASYLAYRLRHAGHGWLAPLVTMRPTRRAAAWLCRRLGIAVILARRASASQP